VAFTILKSKPKITTRWKNSSTHNRHSYTNLKIRLNNCCNALFCCVLQPSSIRGLATPWTYFLRLPLSSVFLIDCFTESPVHVLMSSIQVVRGLPRLRAPGIVRCSVRCGRYVRGRCSDTCRMFCWHRYAVSTTAQCSTNTPLTLIVPPSTGILCVAVVTLTLASDAETGCGRAAGRYRAVD